MIPSIVMMGLGLFRFGMTGPAYDQARRTTEWRHPELMRQGRAPASQFAGPGTDKVTLQATIYPHFKGGLRQTELMRAQADLGVPMLMVDGLGFVWKRWVIISLEERRSYFLPDGAPRRIDFSLTLQAYGEDFA